MSRIPGFLIQRFKTFLRVRDNGEIRFGTDDDTKISADGTGVKIGTAITQKIGFYNVSPIAQSNHIPDGSGSSADNFTAVKAILVVLENLGITKTS